MSGDARTRDDALHDAWQYDVVLADGATIRVRAAQPDDVAGIGELLAGLSDDSRYLRFASWWLPPEAWTVEHLTTVDGVDRCSLVAELDGEVVAVATYERLEEPVDAEFAVVVADAHQGRGIATLLLEELAAAARQVGIRSFIASTLQRNHEMLRVLADSGFVVERTAHNGTIDVRIAITSSPALLTAEERREHAAERRSIDQLLAPGSIAVIGAGRRPATIGHEIMRNLVDGGFTGPVHPVNPRADRILGVPAYPSVLEIPGRVDLAVIAVPAAEVPVAVQHCADKGVRDLVVISAGFSEVGDRSAESEGQLVELARRHGMRMVGPNCMGIVNTHPEVRMNATFAPFVPAPGPIACASQSGAIGIALLARAGDLGVSSFVSLGNKADVSSNDLLQYWEDDPATSVILLYLESFGNPTKFARIARRVARRKPIVAVKSGRTRAGARGAASHTAALATPDVVVDALFRQAGVVRVDTVEQLFETATVLAHQPLPSGRRVAILSNGGGPGILAADACDAAGLEVPELDAEVQETLRAFAPAGAGLRNPVDLVASASAAVYERALRTLLATEGIDAVVAVFVPPLVTRAEDVAEGILAATSDGASKPVVACFLGPAPTKDGPSFLLRAGDGSRGVPLFAFPEPAVAALGRAADYSTWLARPPGRRPAWSDIDHDAAGEVVARFFEREPSGGWVDWAVAHELCRCFGIDLVATRHVHDAAAAVVAAEELGFPCVLKAAAPAIVHKTDVGGVQLELSSPDEVRAAFDRMHRALGATMGGALVQATAPAGVETIAGMTHDAAFGPLVLFGMGGTGAELMRDSALRILPLTDLDAHELVRSLRGSPRLFGYRGARSVDTVALERLLLRVAFLAESVPEVAELDCNPVIVSPTGISIVDVKLRLVPRRRSPDAVRHLPRPTQRDPGRG